MKAFEEKISFAKSGVVKFMGAIGAAVTVAEGFNKAINSSQTLSDEYNRTLDGLRGMVDNLFYSFANGDWSPFLQGLTNSISLAREAYTALDQLGNTRMSYGYFNMKNQAKLQDQIAILKDKDSTEDQKNIARAEANRILTDQKEITEQLRLRSGEAMLALVKKSTGLADLDISQMDIEKALRLDVSAMGDADKEVLSKQYKEFQKQAKDVKNQFTHQRISTEGDMTTTYETLDTEGFRNALKPLLAQYQDAILYNSTLVKESDEWLQNLMDIGQSAFVADRTYASMVKTSNRASQSGTGGNTVKADKKDIEYKAFLQFSENMLRQQVDEALHPKVQAMLDAKKFDFKVYLSTNKEVLEDEINNLSGSIVDLENKLNAAQEAYRYATTDEQRNAISARIGKLQSEKTKIKPIIDTKSGQLEYLQSISSIMGTIASGTQTAGAAFSSYFSAGVQGIQTLLPLVQALMALKKGEAFAGAISSAMNIPWPLSLVALAANVGAVTAAFASIPKFETGGIVPGGMYVGDKILARVNSGELILNRAQQRNIASQLVSGGGVSRVDVHVTGRISGRDIELVQNKRNQFKNRTL